MKGNKMPIKIVPIKKKKSPPKPPASRRIPKGITPGQKPKKMKKGGKTTQKKLDQNAKYLASKAYQTKNSKKSKLIDYLKDLPGTLSKDMSQTKKIRKRAAQVAVGDPIAEKKYGTGKRTGSKSDKYFSPKTDGSVEKPLKSYKRDKNSPNKSGFRVTKKKSGGVMKANMGRLLETFSPAYSVMKGKGPIANMLGMAKGDKVDPMQTEMEKAKKLEAMRAAAKSGTQSNRMSLMSSPTRMKAGGSIKKKKSIDGIATKGRTRG